MLKKTITFDDLEGNEVKKDFYFNLGVDELTELEVEYPKGLSEHIKKVIKQDDRKELMKLFKLLIRKSYGIKHEDGLRFVKSEDVSDSFMQTNAYGELLLELSTSPDAAGNFFNGVLPAKVLKKLSEKTSDEKPPEKDLPAWIKEQREPTDAEVLNMTREEMMLAYRIKNASNPAAELKKLLDA